MSDVLTVFDGVAVMLANISFRAGRRDRLRRPHDSAL